MLKCFVISRSLGQGGLGLLEDILTILTMPKLLVFSIFPLIKLASANINSDSVPRRDTDHVQSNRILYAVFS